MEKHLHILPAWHTASQLALMRLPALVEALHTRHSVTPYIGCELEWYVDQPENERIITEVYHCVEREAGAQRIRITTIKPEKGNGQYEVGFDASNNPVALVQAIHDFRAILMQKAAECGLHILWDAKPFPDDYGSALQVHIHLEDAAGQRLFIKKNDHLSPSLAASLGGLLDITSEATFVAAPQDKDYERFVPKYDAPVNICWGGNNRTVTLRLPLHSGSHCHIEYRLAGADADPASMCGILLAGVLHGLESKLQPGAQMFGVASDDQYNLPSFPHNREEAKQAFCNSRTAREWLGEEWFEVVSKL